MIVSLFFPLFLLYVIVFHFQSFFISLPLFFSFFCFLSFGRGSLHLDCQTVFVCSIEPCWLWAKGLLLHLEKAWTFRAILTCSGTWPCTEYINTDGTVNPQSSGLCYLQAQNVKYHLKRPLAYLGYELIHKRALFWSKKLKLFCCGLTMCSLRNKCKHMIHQTTNQMQIVDQKWGDCFALPHLCSTYIAEAEPQSLRDEW